MAQSSIRGLDGYRLTLAGLKKLGEREVRFSVQLIGLNLQRLRPFRPAQRKAKLHAALKQQFSKLAGRVPDAQLVSRDKRRGSWTLDGRLPARQVRSFAAQPEVQYVAIESIDGRRRMFGPPTPGWFCVWGVVAVQIEGQTKGNVTIEDRLVLVKADDHQDAERRLRRQWRRYARPYMGGSGSFVRWQLISIRDVYSIVEDDLHPDGTEVYSRLRTERMKPEYRWLPTNRRAVRRV